MNIGEFIDPAFVNVDLYGDKEIPVTPSGDIIIEGIVEVPMVDGRIALVDSNGIIVGYKK